MLSLKEFITKYQQWVNAYGISAVPEVATEEFTSVVGFVPSTLLTWRNPIGSRLIQGAEVLMTAASPLAGLRELCGFFNVKEPTGDVEKAWRDLVNPPPPEPTAKPALMGPRVAAEIVAAFAPSGRVDVSRKYYLQGGLDIPDGQLYKSPEGKLYQSVNPGSMFVKWLMELS